MGGCGAIAWALRQPERFAAAASLSGVLDVAAPGRGWSRPEDSHLGCGSSAVATWPAAMTARCTLVATADAASLPALRVACSTEDELLGDHHAFLGAFEHAGVAVTAETGPGAHDWAYWDAQVQQVLTWLPLER